MTDRIHSGGQREGEVIKMEQKPEEGSTKNLLISGNDEPKRPPPICPQCGTWNPPGAEFCKKDGVKLPERGRHAKVSHSSQPHPQPAKNAISTARPGSRADGIITPRVYEPPGGTENLTDPMDIEKDRAKDGKEYTAQGKAANSQVPKSRRFLIAVCILLVAVAGGGFYWYLFVRERAAMQHNLERRTYFDNEIATTAPPPGPSQQMTPSATQPVSPPDVSLGPETGNTMGPGKAIDREMKSEGAPAVSRKARRSRERRTGEGVRDEAVKKRAFTAAPAYSRPKNTGNDIQARPKEQAPDRAKIERDINRLLRDSGVGGITAEVSESMTATLKGKVLRNEDRRKALSVAKGFNEVKSVKDVIFVIGP
ncbi:MAG TPA: hypothetical protein VGJ94_17270 [Syntrophorhabdaceae bacterium]|jgi:hypothetical protein